MLFYCNTNATRGLAIEAALDIAALRCVSVPRCMEMLAVGGKCPPLAGSLINLVPDQFPSRQGGLLAVRPAVRPLIRRGGVLQPATWDEAMDLISKRTAEVRDRYTASAIGFYTTGHLFLEEYYTLGVIGKAGLGTPHMDGNTRLCTATAAAALKETFGCDGQPGSYFDIDETDCIVMVGHNMAATDTVLWMRVLDRRRGERPPKLIVIDPRQTASAKEADIHLAPRVGTNVALLNGILHLIVANGWIDRPFIEAHTTGFADLEQVLAGYPPE